MDRAHTIIVEDGEKERAETKSETKTDKPDNEQLSSINFPFPVSTHRPKLTVNYA